MWKGTEEPSFIRFLSLSTLPFSIANTHQVLFFHKIYYFHASDEKSYIMKIEEDDESFHLTQVLVSETWYLEIWCFRSKNLFSHFGCLLCMGWKNHFGDYCSRRRGEYFHQSISSPTDLDFSSESTGVHFLLFCSSPRP